MAKKLRLSPSGPIIADIGDGFIVKAYRQSIAADSGQYTLPSATLVQFGAGAPPVAAGLQVSVTPGHKYAATLSAMFSARALATNVLQMAVQYSNDGGTVWTDVARNSLSVPGLALAASSDTFRVDLAPDAVLGSALLPSAADGIVAFRGVCQWGGTTAQLSWITGTGVGSTQLQVLDLLAS